LRRYKLGLNGLISVGNYRAYTREMFAASPVVLDIFTGTKNDAIFTAVCRFAAAVDAAHCAPLSIFYVRRNRGLAEGPLTSQ
jgi:hypothetical protein